MSSPRVAEDSVVSSADDSSEVVLLKRRLRHTQQNIQFLQGSNFEINFGKFSFKWTNVIDKFEFDVFHEVFQKHKNIILNDLLISSNKITIDI